MSVQAIQNDFFGPSITVSGLITGADLYRQLSGTDLGDRLLLPCSMLRSGEEGFLDDMTVTELAEKLKTEIVIVDEEGEDLVEAILNPSGQHR